jgi:TfoX/Sxy family transcriptional regulator of competence genes
MASKPEFVQYITEQLHDAGCVTYRKMFGEYGMYCNGKIFALICENQLFIKITDAGRRLCPELREAAPYEGAKNYFLVEDVDNRDALVSLVTVTCTVLPEPKPKKRRRLM